MSGLLATSLALRDVHLPSPPPWWPLAPGWWLLIGALGLLCLVLLGRWLRTRLRLRRLAAEFDQRLQQVDTPVAQVGLAAELLRRAALAREPAAATLQGEDWLAWLDGGKDRGFVRGAGRLLLEGGYRPRVEAAEMAALWPLAREAWARLRLGMDR